MTFTSTSKVLHGTSANTSNGISSSTATTSIVDGSFIFPYIVIQSGFMDNTIIGTNTPNSANFTSVTASNLQLFNNTISLGTVTNNSLQGIVYNTNQFFGVDKNANVFTFKNTDTGVLGNAQFNNIVIGTGTNTISSNGTILQLNTSGQVQLPTGTQAYRPTVERKILHVTDTLPTTQITLDPNTNVSFISIVADTPLTVANTTTLLLSDSDFDGFVKIIHVSDCPPLVTIQLIITIQDPGTGILQSNTLKFPNGGICTQIMYDMTRLCWLLLDTGLFIS